MKSKREWLVRKVQDLSIPVVTARVMGTFLTWMQEKEEPVFVLATSNNIDQLPPEMLRKGRFDEIFFVDLPGANTRSEIIGIHLKKKGRNEEAESFDIRRLAEASVGYSGAELEEAVKDALFRAFDAGREIEEQDILEALKATYPLSKTMRGKHRRDEKVGHVSRSPRLE